MSWRRQLAKLGARFRRPRPGDDLEEEIRSHLRMEEQENLESGMSPDEAHYAALRRFGNVTLTQERSREVWGRDCVETLWQDLHYGLRMLAKNPGFTAVAVLTLALGIGGNTAMFTVIRAVLLKPLKYSNPDRLMRVSGGATSMRFEEIKKTSRSYTEIGAFADGLENLTLSGGAEPEVLKGARVSANFLHILGVEPLLGRSFLPEEDMPGGPPVAMISAELWHRQFGGDPLIAGRTATLNLTPSTIIGVLPTGFQFPFPGVDVWVTRPSEWSVTRSSPLSPILTVFARLKPQVNLEQASAELALLNHQYAIAHPGMLDSRPDSIEQVAPLKDELVANVRSVLWMLFGAVSFVLLIVCANVASLLLARATSRSREFAVRAALGASRGRLIGQLLAESVLLSFVGGAWGVLLAKWSTRGIASMTALNLPQFGEFRLDGMVLGFAVGLSIATGVVFGLIPSLGASRPDLARVLRASGEPASSGGSKRARVWFSTRGLLVMGQVGLSIVLLIGATLLIESLARLHDVDPGFQPANLLTMRIALPPTRYDTVQKRAAFFEELVQRVESAPGVRSATVAITLPMTGFARTPLQIADEPPLKLNERPLGIIQDITPGYFRTLEIPLRRGREFSAHDILSAVPVAMLNESLARRLWPSYPNGPDPVGQHILIGASPQPVEVVGIVKDVHQAGLGDYARAGVYRPCAQHPPLSAMVAVRTQGDPLRFANAVRREILAIDRDQPVSAVRTMEDVVKASEGQRRLVMTLLGLFAGVALLLAMVGIYGVISYSVRQRTHEIGIRMTLGAERKDLLKMVLGEGFKLTLTGLAIGVMGALALTRFLTSLLYGVTPADPLTFVAVSLLFTAMALLASYIPARRATKVDPMVALRYE